MTKTKAILITVFLIVIGFGKAWSQIVISSLEGEYKDGQIFLTWNETNITDSTQFNVYINSVPITVDNLSSATKVGHHIETSSACDWWQNPASFSADSVDNKTNGFKLHDRTLDPASGLFVHTVKSTDPGQMYFAVTYSNGSSEDQKIVSGENSLLNPVQGMVSEAKPIPLDNELLPGSTIGKSLILQLHGRGSDASVSSNANFLFFGGDSHGWREGLARKFYVGETEESIIIMPFDRTWIGRPLLYSRDKRDHVPAINTFWYGCNNMIYDEELSQNGEMVDYTEKFLLYLVKWAQEYYETDPDRTYLEGVSMGGAGGISVGFHNPEVFARIESKVPIVAFTDKSGSDERSSLYRLDGVCGKPCDSTIYTSTGIRFIDYMNGEKTVREFKGELPYLVVCNGRNDESIPWINNPSFYQALDETNRGFYCYWDNGAHNMHDSLPEDFSDLFSLIPEIKKSLSYPAFSESSVSKDPGNGEKADGDIIGWKNRGIYWGDLTETADSWSAKIFTKGDFIQYPLSVSVIPRNLTQFQPGNNEMLIADYSGSQKSVQANENGIVKVDGIVINSAQDTVKLTISKTATRKEQLNSQLEFSVYPNPVKDWLTVNLTKLYKNVKIEIVNGSGQLVSQSEFQSVSELNLPFTKKPGLYFVRIQTDEGTGSVVKVIKN